MLRAPSSVEAKSCANIPSANVDLAHVDLSLSKAPIGRCTCSCLSRLRTPCPGEYVSEEVSLAVVVVVVLGQRAPSRRTSLPHTLQKRHSALFGQVRSLS